MSSTRKRRELVNLEKVANQFQGYHEDYADLIHEIEISNARVTNTTKLGRTVLQLTDLHRVPEKKFNLVQNKFKHAQKLSDYIHETKINCHKHDVQIMMVEPVKKVEEPENPEPVTKTIYHHQVHTPTRVPQVYHYVLTKRGLSSANSMADETFHPNLWDSDVTFEPANRQLSSQKTRFL